MKAARSIKGLNVIGHLSSSSGLGNTARLMIQMLQANGVEVVGYDVNYSRQAEIPTDQGLRLVNHVAELPFRDTLVIVTIQALPMFWLKHPELLDSSRFRHAGMLFWELPVLPPAWAASIRPFDVLLMSCPWMRQMFEDAVPEVPTLLIEHPLPRQLNTVCPEDTRAKLGIPADTFLCLSSFDLRSSWARKNPEANVLAFQRAFEGRSDVRMLIKTGNTAGVGSRQLMLLERIHQDPRITLVQEPWPYEQVLNAYACADVYLSLHRAEGLGLGPMESMMLGRCVVATGYSGNMGFMTPLNSRPVRYQLVVPEHVEWQFKPRFAGSRARWAEADVDDAAQALRQLEQDARLRQELGQRAAADMQARQDWAWSAPFLDDMMHCLAHPRPRTSWQMRAAILWQELRDPTLRSLNASAIWAKLRR